MWCGRLIDGTEYRYSIVLFVAGAIIPGGGVGEECVLLVLDAAAVLVEALKM